MITILTIGFVLFCVLYPRNPRCYREGDYRLPDLTLDKRSKIAYTLLMLDANKNLKNKI